MSFHQRRSLEVFAKKEKLPCTKNSTAVGVYFSILHFFMLPYVNPKVTRNI